MPYFVDMDYDSLFSEPLGMLGLPPQIEATLWEANIRSLGDCVEYFIDRINGKHEGENLPSIDGLMCEEIEPRIRAFGLWRVVEPRSVTLDMKQEIIAALLKNGYITHHILYHIEIDVLHLPPDYVRACNRVGVTTVGDILDMINRKYLGAMVSLRIPSLTFFDDLEETVKKHGYGDFIKRDEW